jgi:predicted DNA-binding transcriptional regulator AlpA
MGKAAAYLSISQIAARTGLARNTIKVYVQTGRLPPHDATIGRVKGWLAETIDNWWAQRQEAAAERDRAVRNGDDGKTVESVLMTG